MSNYRFSVNNQVQSDRPDLIRHKNKTILTYISILRIEKNDINCLFYQETISN